MYHVHGYFDEGHLWKQCTTSYILMGKLPQSAIFQHVQVSICPLSHHNCLRRKFRDRFKARKPRLTCKVILMTGMHEGSACNQIYLGVMYPNLLFFRPVQVSICPLAHHSCLGRKYRVQILNSQAMPHVQG